MSEQRPDDRDLARDRPKNELAARTKPRQKPQSRPLPPYKVLLHNDDVNEINYVLRTVMELTHLSRHDAKQRVLEAHYKGIALLLVTHKERAELYVEQFASKKLTATLEPA